MSAPFHRLVQLCFLCFALIIRVIPTTASPRAPTPSPAQSGFAVGKEIMGIIAAGVEARTAFENEEPGIVQVADGKWAEMESERAQKKGCFSCF